MSIQHFCVSCGAPHEPERGRCSYCLTVYREPVTIFDCARHYGYGWIDPRQLYTIHSNIVHNAQSKHNIYIGELDEHSF